MGNEERSIETLEGKLAKISDKVDAVNGKVEKHSRFFGVAAIVATIFGFSGAWGGYVLNGIESRLTTASRQVETVSEKVKDLDKNADKLMTEAAKRAREETGLPVAIADDPLASVVLGTGKMLSDFNLLRQVCID